MPSELNNQHLDNLPNLEKESDIDTSVSYSSAQSNSILEGGPGHPSYYKDTLSMPLTPEQAEAIAKSPSLAEMVVSKAKKVINKFLDRKETTKPIKKSASTEKPEVTSQPEEKDEVVSSISDMVAEAKEEAKQEYEKTKDVTTKALLGYMESLEVELGKEKLNWKQIEFFVRQIAILLTQKMAANENKQIEQLHEMMRNDINQVIKSYKGKWELILGIASGSLQIVGGGLGIGGGFAGIGGVSKGTLKTIQSISQGFSSTGSGVQPFTAIARNANERGRTLHNFELERDRGYKGNAESALQGDRSSRSGQISQTNSFIESAFRAFVSVAQ